MVAKMMTGLLSSHGINVSQQQVGESLSRVSPAYQDARRTSTARQTNPAPYYADYAYTLTKMKSWSCME